MTADQCAKLIRLILLGIAAVAISGCDYQTDVEGVVTVHFEVQRVEAGPASFFGSDHTVLTTDGRIYEAADDTWIRLVPGKCFEADFLSHNEYPLIENIKGAACT